MQPDNHRSADDTWLDRHPGLVVVLVSAGLLGVVQAAVLLSRSTSFPGGWPMLVGFSKLGLLSGLLTWALLALLALPLRHWHPAWKRGQRLEATWSVCIGLTAALSGFMVADALLSPVVGGAAQPWLELSIAVLLGWMASLIRIAPRVLKAGAILTVLLVVLSLLPIGPSFSQGQSPSVPVASATPQPDAPDIILISIDTLRADRLGAYGWSPSLTPRLDRLAREGVVFERVLASSPWTVPSVASMLTGLPSLGHQAGMPLSSGLTFLRSPLAEDFTTLAEHLAAAGYRTRGVVSNPYLDVGMGMAQGFQHYESPLSTAMAALFMYDLPLGRLLLAVFPIQSWSDFRAEGITSRALEWLAEDDPAPLFLWAHYIDPHSPYRSDPRSMDLSAMMREVRGIPPPVLEDGTVVDEVFAATSFVRSGTLWLGRTDRLRLEEYYDRSIRYLDQEVGRIFDVLRERSDQRPAVVAFTADHGEEFWDHGHFEHGHDYYREVTAVPLIFWGPDTIPAGTRVPRPVGLVDVAPTLLQLAGLQVEPPPGIGSGRSVARLWESASEAPGPPRFSEINLYGLPAVLVEQENWRYLLRANGVEELYEMVSDPRERRNRVADYPELAAQYRALCEPRLALLLREEKQTPGEISPEMLEALRSLGYVR